MKNKKQSLEDIEYEVGSGNVFADLGFENPEEELTKSNLVGEITRLIKRKKLTQTQAAKILGVDQPRISSLLRGRLDLFSIEMLMRFLNDLDRDIEIFIKPKAKNRKHGHLTVHISNASRPSVPLAAKSR